MSKKDKEIFKNYFYWGGLTKGSDNENYQASICMKIETAIFKFNKKHKGHYKIRISYDLVNLYIYLDDIRKEKYYVSEFMMLPESMGIQDYFEYFEMRLRGIRNESN